jgi:hypothetical protein
MLRPHTLNPENGEPGFGWVKYTQKTACKNYTVRACKNYTRVQTTRLSAAHAPAVVKFLLRAGMCRLISKLSYFLVVILKLRHLPVTWCWKIRKSPSRARENRIGELKSVRARGSALVFGTKLMLTMMLHLISFTLWI